MVAVSAAVIASGEPALVAAQSGRPNAMPQLQLTDSFGLDELRRARY